MSDLSKVIFNFFIPFYLFLILYSTCVISLKDFHYIVCMYFFTMNDTVVFFSVKHIELLYVRNVQYK